MFGRFSARLQILDDRCSSSSALAPSCCLPSRFPRCDRRVVCSSVAHIATSAKSTWAGAAGTKEEADVCERARSLTPYSARTGGPGAARQRPLVRFLYTTTRGHARKAPHVESPRSRITDGTAHRCAMQAMICSITHPGEVMGPVGEIRLKARSSDLHPPAVCAARRAMTVDMLHPRRRAVGSVSALVLKRQIAACAAAASPCGRRSRESSPWPSGAPTAPSRRSISRSVLHHWHGHGRLVMDEHRGRPRSAGNTGRAILSELGHGQQELSIRHAPALAAADRQCSYARRPRSPTATAYASSRPSRSRQAGNAARALEPLGPGGPAQPHHDPQGASGSAGSAITSSRACSSTCQRCSPSRGPSVNSYRRLPATLLELGLHGVGPGQSGGRRPYPSTFASDPRGIDQRGAEGVRRLGQSVLALGGLLAAGLDGVTRQLEPVSRPWSIPPTYTDAERASRRHCAIPATLAEPSSI